jgi:Cu-Zn family superoxide dismutase
MQFVGALALLLGVQAQGPPLTATTDLHVASGQWLATATFRETQSGVLIEMNFRQGDALTGTHALQIHSVGQCYPPTFDSAGPIFNPFGKQHGLLNPGGPMAGDLPNLVIGPDGSASYTLPAPLVTLRPGSASLLRQGGTSLVIYERPDDDRSQAEGNAGARIACGAIVASPGGAPTAASDGGPLGGLATLIIGGVGLLLAGVGLALRRR